MGNLAEVPSARQAYKICGIGERQRFSVKVSDRVCGISCSSVVEQQDLLETSQEVGRCCKVVPDWCEMPTVDAVTGHPGDPHGLLSVHTFQEYVVWTLLALHRDY